MQVITLNVNGIRSAESKGLSAWLATRRGWDILCVQELKAMPDDVPDAMRHPGKRSGYFFSAQKKGYSGVGLYCKQVPDLVTRGIGVKEFDDEGRFLQADFGNVSIVSVYYPSGAAGPERQASKFRFLDAFAPHLAKLKASGREIILCGDVNIAHQQIDLKNWKSNQKNSGFLPEERAWLSARFAQGWVDVFRTLYPTAETYTWWSNRGNAYANNVGWRLDYQIATPGIAAHAKKASVYTDTRFSDHAPLIVDYDFTL